MPLTTDIKPSFEQYDMTPGNPGRRFRRNFLIHGTKSDEAGFSIADTLLREDEGGTDAAGNPAPGAPTIPAAVSVANDKRRALRTSRIKGSFNFIVAHISDEPTKTLLADPPFFQVGPTTYDYVMGEVLIPVDQGQLNEMTLLWLTMTIISYVGYNENSIIANRKIGGVASVSAQSITTGNGRSYTATPLRDSPFSVPTGLPDNQSRRVSTHAT